MTRIIQLFAAMLALLSTTGAQAVERPNILIIVADDLGWRDVPWHGSDYVMPNLEKLARQSLRLEAHYVHPMCSPTRAAVLSGRYASRFGCVGAQNERVYPFDTITLATALHSTGYTTALTGKWHLGSLPEWGPNQFGFDHSYGSLAGGVGPYDHKYKRGPYTDTWQRNGERIEEEGHVTDLIAREAQAFLRRDHAAPFFLYVPFTAIHIPMDEPQMWLDKNLHISNPGDRLRAACATHMDAAIGQLLTALDETGRRNNTLVLFFGDNGAHDLYTNNDPQYPGAYPALMVGRDNAPLRGYKSGLYEGGIRSPTIVSWPGRLRPGVIDEPLHACDWMPTLTKLAGYQPPHDLRWDGGDIWPLLTGESTTVASAAGGPRTLYCLGANSRDQTVRRGPWKLLINQKADVELYNLADDIGERQNVAGLHPELVTDLKQRMKELAARDGESKVEDPHKSGWVPSKNNPVLRPGAPGAWDENMRERMWVTKEAGRFYGWYTGWRGNYNKDAPKLVQLGYATSDDGVHWTKHPGNPIFTDRWTEDPCVVKHGETYYMYAEDETGDRTVIHLLTSTDRVNWKAHGTVLPRREGITWEARAVGTPVVWRESEKKWLMLYDAWPPGLVAIATSENGIQWNRNDQNQLLTAAADNHWKTHSIVPQSILRIDGKYHLYYHANDLDFHTGHAVSSDLLNWTADEHNPILPDKSAVVLDAGDSYFMYTSKDGLSGVINLYTKPK
jgi:arylsulfatase A-like enzyme/predicted GH43/DUF377 family glycosyl hydrolase